MNFLKQATEFIRWWSTANTRHGIHSPFLYQFIDECLYASSNLQDFSYIENIRKQLLHDNTVLHYYDLGAGNKKQNTDSSPQLKSRKVSHIARYSLQSPRFCRLFYRMIQYFDSRSILELGTSMGITTSYLATSNASARIDTIEGAETIAGVANSIFRKINIQNVRLQVGNFDELLPKIHKDKKYDMIIIDGNHRGEATLRYFIWCSKHIGQQGVVIIDDIRWSQDMLETWKSIQKHPDVTLTVDLFFLGLVFFDKRLSKENFKIRF